MGFTSILRISGSALTAERLRMDVIASNIANAHTTGPDAPYARRRVIFRATPLESSRAPFAVTAVTLAKQAKEPRVGVRVVRIEQDTGPGQRVYDPSHPDADVQGYVTYPNVNIVTEMIDLLTATRSYEANANVISAAKVMASKALSISSK